MTHQLNVGALVGVYPVEGEIVVLTPPGEGHLRIAGGLGPDALARN